MNLAHAASVFRISVVQNIGLDGPHDQLVGFQRCRLLQQQASAGDYSHEEGYVTAKAEFANVKIGYRYHIFHSLQQGSNTVKGASKLLRDLVAAVTAAYENYSVDQFRRVHVLTYYLPFFTKVEY